MTTYAVKRSLPGITMELLGAAQKAAIATSNEFTEQGTKVKYIRSNFFPGDSSCTCLFEAEDKDAVKAVYSTTLAIKPSLKYVHFNTGDPIHDAYLAKLHMQVHRTIIPPELIHAVDENILKLATRLTKA